MVGSSNGDVVTINDGLNSLIYQRITSTMPPPPSGLIDYYLAERIKAWIDQGALECAQGEDCAGICGGDTIEDLCGVCDPCGNNIEGPCVDSTTGTDPWNDCEKVVYGISSVNRNLGTLDIFIENTISIQGMELWFNNNIFLLDQAASGGLLEEYNFKGLRPSTDPSRRY